MKSRATITAVIAALTLLWMIWSSFAEKEVIGVPVLIEDASGVPQPDIVVVGPGGAYMSPDAFGAILLPHSWTGKTLYLRDAKTGKRIMNFQLSPEGDAPRTLTVPPRK